MTSSREIRNGGHGHHSDRISRGDRSGGLGNSEEGEGNVSDVTKKGVSGTYMEVKYGKDVCCSCR